MRGGFSGGMHPVLRNFVHAARGRFLMEAEKLIQRSRALARRIRFFDGLRDISFREDYGLAKILAAGELRGDRRGESASRSVRIGTFDVIAAERLYLAAFA